MERLETINRLLADFFGVDTDDSKPIFRVVWSDDQIEKRLSKHTDSGIELLTPVVRELPKYQWLPHLYVLERRVLVPSDNQNELAGVVKSYEPLWAFVDKDGNPIPPSFQACKFVIDAVYAAMGKSSLAKYKDPNAGLTAEEHYEKRQAEIKKLEEELFGNESGLKQETIGEGGSAIIVPQNYSKSIH